MVTNNSASTWTFHKRDLKQELSRWILTLQEYNYDVRHRPAYLNKVADALSWNPVEKPTFQDHHQWIVFSWGDVIVAQRADLRLGTAMFLWKPRVTSHTIVASFTSGVGPL